MPQSYKIIAVGKTPKEWSSQYGEMKTYLVQVEGNGEPVQLNKKAESPAPQVGDEIYGDVQATEYGQKFKGAKKPFNQSGGKSYSRDDSAIRAQWAIGQSLTQFDKNMYQSMDENRATFLANLEDLAKELYAMVDRVKNSEAVTDTKKDWIKPETRERLNQAKELAEEQQVHQVTAKEMEDDINLDDIPF